MPNRILKETICSSETINKLTEAEENLFYRLIVQCDDYGRLDARPRIIISKCYPLKMYEISEEDIIQRLLKLAQVGLIKFYIASDNKPYLQITNWDEHQRVRNKKSKYPDPLRFVDNPYCNITAISTNSQQLQSQCSQTSATTQQLTAENEHMTVNCSRLTADCGQLTAIENNINQQETIAGNRNQLSSIDSLNPNPNTNPNNNKSKIAYAILPRTGSDEPTCVTEEHRTSTTTQEKKLEGEQGMAVTSEPEQVTETAVLIDTNNNALNTTGEDELEQLLEEFFEDEGESAESQDTAKTDGESKGKNSSDPVEVPGYHETAKFRERLNTTGEELENSKESNTIPQGQETARTHDHLTVLREENEKEPLKGFFGDNGDRHTTNSTLFAERKDTATACMTAPELIHSKMAESDNFICGLVENLKQGLETSVSEPITQDKLKEISQMLQQNKTECGKRDVPATNDDDFQEEEKEIQELTNQKLIARLVGKYRHATGTKSRDDFPRMGRLYLEFNYAVVEQAIGVLAKRLQNGVQINDPLAYLYKVCEGIEKKVEERREKYKKKENKGRNYSLLNFSPEVLKIVEGGYENDL